VCVCVCVCVVCVVFVWCVCVCVWGVCGVCVCVFVCVCVVCGVCGLCVCVYVCVCVWCLVVKRYGRECSTNVMISEGLRFKTCPLDYLTFVPISLISYQHKTTNYATNFALRIFFKIHY